MPTIELSRLTKTYQRGQPPAVDGIDLRIEDTELLCLLGPSGCGKTTTLRMLAGLESITSGSITVGDQVWDDSDKGITVPANRRQAPLVFQSYALWPHLSVAENVAFGLKTAGVPAAERSTRVRDVLSTLSINQYADRFPADLSGGQQQRVALARALALRPEVMLLDEPLSNLDSQLRLRMRAELLDLHKDSGTTMVMVTHDQWEAMTLSTRIAVMNNGHIAQVGTPQEIYTNPQTKFIAQFIGNPPINMVDLDGDGPLAAELRSYLEVRWGHGVVSQVSSVGIRPEDIRLGSHAMPGALELDASVVSAAPTGGSWIVETQLGRGAENRLLSSALHAPDARVNDQVTLTIEDSRILLFNSNDNRITA